MLLATESKHPIYRTILLLRPTWPASRVGESQFYRRSQDYQRFGDPTHKEGLAVHIDADNASMVKRAFVNI